VATIANVAVTLQVLGFTGFGINPQIWSSVLIIIATGLTSFIVIKRSDIVYGLVIVWALLGIFVKYTDAANTVAYIALLSTCFILGLLAWHVYNYLKNR
jgi:hypothetical protein